MRIIAPLTILALSACSPSRGDGIFGDSAGVVRSPERVLALRLAKQQRPFAGAYADWPADGAPVAVDPALAAELARLLFDDASYRPADAPPKTCIFNPGVRIDFVRGASTAPLYLCFDCLQLVGPKGGADFDPAARAFGAVVKKLFPKDPEIQSLKG
jgi:hypothetical protein